MLSVELRGVKICLSLLLCPYFVCVSSEDPVGPGISACSFEPMIHICDEYQTLGNWQMIIASNSNSSILLLYNVKYMCYVF